MQALPARARHPAALQFPTSTPARRPPIPTRFGDAPPVTQGLICPQRWPGRYAPRALLCALAGLIPLAAQAAPPTLAQCHGIKDLAFVAHLDDDLLFMNPDIASNIEAGGCVRLVYLTASDAGEGDGYAGPRARRARGLCLHGASAR